MADNRPQEQDGSSPVRGTGLMDYINISFYSFGLRGFTFALSAIIVPVLILDMVPADRKNTYLGLATFATLMLSIVTIPAMGALSDRVRLPRGRRLPYIFLGTILACALLPGLAVADNFLLFVFILGVITLGVTTAQGPFQAFIPDLVPEDKRGAASAIKVVAEILGIATIAGLVGYVAGRYDSTGEFHWLWASLAVLAFLYLVVMIITVFRVVEEPVSRADPNETRSTPQPTPDPRDRLFPPGLPWYLVSRFLFLAATGIIETFGLFYLQDVVEVGNPAEATGILSVIFGLAALVGALSAGRISERTGYQPLIAFAGLLGAVGIGILLMADNLQEVVASGLIIGVGAGMFFSADWALAIALVSPGRAAEHMGLTSVATNAGAAAARLLGFGVDSLNSGGGDRGYEGVFFICGIAFLLGGFLVFAVRPAPATPIGHE